MKPPRNLLPLALAALVSFPALLSCPAAALAQGDPEAERTRLYGEAVAMATAGRWDDAARTLRAVLALRSSPKVRFTLGQAEEHVGRLSAAYDAYVRALADAKAAGEKDVVATVEAARHDLEPRVPRLRIVVTGERAADATLTIDDVVVHGGEPVRVDPGSHRVAAHAEASRPATSTISVGEGQSLEVPLRLDRETPATGSTSASSTPSSDGAGWGPWRTAGLVAAGAGVVALGVGTYFGVDAISENNTSNGNGCSGNSCSSKGYGTREDALSAATASTAAFVVGGLLAATGITLWFVAPKRPAPVAVTPIGLRSGGGIGLTGAW